MSNQIHNPMMVRDFMGLSAQDIDLDLIEARLWRMQRFNGHPGALMVRPHTGLVQQLAVRDDAPSEVIAWSYAHDDHEGVIGDIIGPVKALVNKETKVIDRLEEHLDHIICEARGSVYPSNSTREATHYYDKLAESLEWQFGLGYDDQGFHPPWPIWLDREQAQHLFEWAGALVE